MVYKMYLKLKVFENFAAWLRFKIGQALRREEKPCFPLYPLKEN